MIYGQFYYSLLRKRRSFLRIQSFTFLQFIIVLLNILSSESDPIGLKDLFKNYVPSFRFMYSRFRPLTIETKKVKEIDCLFNKLRVGRKQLSHELTLLLGCFCEAPREVCKTSFLAERNYTSTTVTRKVAPFPVASTLSNLSV